MIDDVEVTSAGEIIILDRVLRTVRVFDEDGSFLYSLPGYGQGPGEMELPIALALVTEDLLYVFDQVNLIHRYQRRGGQFVFADRVRLDASPVDACLNDGEVVIHTRTGSSADVLRAVQSDGGFRLSFAVPYRYTLASRAYEAMSRGRIACSGGLAILAFDLRNGIEAYRVDSGTLAWHARFEGLAMTRVIESKEGRKIETGVFNEPGAHWLSRLSGGTGTPLLVQYAYVTNHDYRERTGVTRIDTYAVDPQTGEGEFWGSSIDPLLYVSNEHAVFLRQDPYPQVIVASLPPLGH